jgi:hypothetical protein
MAKIPIKHKEVVIDFLTDLFTGKIPEFDPTVDKPIPVAALHKAIWKRTSWGSPPEKEMKKSNGAWGNVRTSVREMLDTTNVIILSNGNSANNVTGYYRPTLPEHYDQAYTTAKKLAESYEAKARRLKEAKSNHFPNSPIKEDTSTMYNPTLFEDLFD